MNGIKLCATVCDHFDGAEIKDSIVSIFPLLMQEFKQNILPRVAQSTDELDSDYTDYVDAILLYFKAAVNCSPELFDQCVTELVAQALVIL